MDSPLGELLRVARDRQGWDQGDLARAVAVTQQTVSRWERGDSRPKRDVIARLASILDVDIEGLSIAAGYGPVSDRHADPAAPVRPHETVLPLHQLAADRFEEFVADLVRILYPKAEVSRFGSQGHTQYGFDVVAQEGGVFPAGFQCKRRAQFGPKEVTAAVAAATLDVGRPFIALSRIASPDSRIAIAKHPQWSLWDKEDLSREVRALPMDDALRIVDTYFPSWRESFLGASDPGPWLDQGGFFRPLTSSGVYTHEWQLVGRRDQVEEVLQFVNGPVPVGYVVGRGGIGKTRLLREIASRVEAGGGLARFVMPGAEVSAEHFELLPANGRLLVMVDDAHERSDLTAIVRSVALRNPDARVLLSLRPYGIGLLASDLRQVGLHPTDIPRWNLEDLAPEEAEALARDALGPDVSSAIVRRLALLTADCPLITVVAGVLIRRGQLDPTCLDHEDTVRQEVLRTFRDVIVADPLGRGSNTRREVLNAVSALQPFRSNDPTFQEALAGLIGEPYDRAIAHLRGLEDAGVLLRRGSALRVVPDLLGDIVLTEASFDERSGTSTRYIERAVDLAETAPLQNLFVNASRIDWQIRHDHEGAPRLTDGLWEQFSLDFQSAGILDRRRLVQSLRRVAHFAPEPTLRLARQVVDAPTELIGEVSAVEAAFLELHPPTYRDVLEELPPILRGVSYNVEHLPAALDLLRDLAKSDDRPLNQHQNHPHRVLQDLAKLELGKPLAYNHAVIDAAERWLRDPDPAAGNDVFDILEPMLVTEGMENRLQGFQLTFEPFVLTPDSVASVRVRILDLAFNHLTSADVRVAIQAVQAIGSALRYPHGYFGQDPGESQREAWTAEFVEVLTRLTDAVRQEDLDPAVVIAIRQAIRPHADHSSSATRDAARTLRSALPSRLSDQLALALFDGWGNLTDDREPDFEQARIKPEARSRSLAAQLIAVHDDAEIVRVLEERVLAQESLTNSGGASGPFVRTLVELRPSVGVAIVEATTANPESSLSSVVAHAIAALAEHDPTAFVPAISVLLAAGNLNLRRQVAQSLSWRDSRGTLLPGEGDVLAELAVDPDVITRTAIVRAAQRLAHHDREQAVRLLMSVPFADAPQVAEELLQTFGPHGDLDWRTLPTSTMNAFLEQLVRCPSIEDYWINAFLADYSGENAKRVVDFLQERIELEGANPTDRRYHALPFNWDETLKAREAENFADLLHDIRNWIAADPDSWRAHRGGELFSAVAVHFDETVMSVLEDGARTGDEAQLDALASILREAPSNFVFAQVDFVRRLLALASQRGDEYVRRVGGALSAAASSGTRSGIAGQPFTEDLQQRDLARSIADKLPKGSPEERLFRSLQRSAEQSISWASEQDDLRDGRDW